MHAWVSHVAVSARQAQAGRARTCVRCLAGRLLRVCRDTPARPARARCDQPRALALALLPHGRDGCLCVGTGPHVLEAVYTLCTTARGDKAGLFLHIMYDMYYMYNMLDIMCFMHI